MISAAGHGWKRRVGNYQKLKTDLAVTSLTLSWVEATSLYKMNTVITLKVKANDGPDLVYRPHGQHYNLQYTCKRSGRVSVHWWGWSSAPGRPVLSAHFAKCNGALCTDALSWWYNPFTARPLLHLWFLCGSRMAIAAGRCRTPWLATLSVWYEPHR